MGLQIILQLLSGFEEKMSVNDFGQALPSGTKIKSLCIHLFLDETDQLNKHKQDSLALLKKVKFKPESLMEQI